jgi:hypothetical protein
MQIYSWYRARPVINHLKVYIMAETMLPIAIVVVVVALVVIFVK